MFYALPGLLPRSCDVFYRNWPAVLTAAVVGHTHTHDIKHLSIISTMVTCIRLLWNDINVAHASDHTLFHSGKAQLGRLLVSTLQNLMLASWCVKKWDLSLSVLSFQPHWGACTPLCQDSWPWQAAEFPAWNNRYHFRGNVCADAHCLQIHVNPLRHAIHTYHKTICSYQSCWCHSNTKGTFSFLFGEYSKQQHNSITYVSERILHIRRNHTKGPNRV